MSATALPDEARRAILTAVPEVLETMFFAVLEAVPGTGSIPASGGLDISRATFSGSVGGQVIVAANTEQTASFADAFLALEAQEDRAANTGLVLGELTNMICGAALGRLWPDGIFSISTPVTQLSCPASELRSYDSEWLEFPLDSGSVFVTMTMEVAG